MTRDFDPNRMPISDERMLDWIDGVLSAEEERRLELQCDPATVALVKRMRTDRAKMEELSTVRAPSDLHDRLMEVFERESLLDPSLNPLPISSFKLADSHARPRSTPMLPLALAAGMLLFVGGAAYLLVGGRAQRTEPSIGTEYALQREEVVLPEAPDVESVGDATSISDAPAQVAGVNVEIETAASAARSKIPMSDDRVLMLAREGRVVMRVVGDDMNALDRLKAGGLNPMYGREWKLRDHVPDALAKAVEPDGMPFGLNSAEEFTFASSDALGLIGPRAALNWPMGAFVDRAARVRATWLADVPMTPAALKAFRAVMADRLDAKVVFEELQQPIEIPPSLDPAATLWWTRGSSRWAGRMTLPVVIEER